MTLDASISPSVSDLSPAAQPGAELPAISGAQFAPLPEFRVFAATGVDAPAFLHGQLTHDVTGLGPDAARFAGYCTAKGRLLATMVFWHAAPAENGDPVIQGFLRADIAEAVIKKLSMFVLRAKVKFSFPESQVWGVQAETAAQQTIVDAAGAVPETPWRAADLPSGTWIAAPVAEAAARWWWIANEAQRDLALPALRDRASEVVPASFRMKDLQAGLPWVSAPTQDVFIPQTLNLDLVDGVSFTKGCYPGQEVVARSHYRGTVKRRMALGTLAGGAAADTDALRNLDIFDARHPDEPCGRVVDAAGHGAVALVFETTLASLPEGDLRLGAADGPVIHVQPLPYALA